MEFPISFFLDYAWNVNKWNEDNLNDYYTQWAAKQFGSAYAKEIGDILKKYAQYASRRKPELLDANTYALSTYAQYDEINKVGKEWNDLQQEAERINDLLPEDYKDAFFELVLHSVKAFANLLNLYAAVAWNKYYVAKSSLSANEYANNAKFYYKQDSLITIEYNNVAKGKWNHMMDQTHIGYTYWQQPDKQIMPEVKYVQTGEPESLPGQELITQSSENLIPANIKRNIFFELDGYVSIEASHFTTKKDAANIKWKTIPNIGKDGDGITTFPVTASKQKINANTPQLEYDFYTYDSGSFKLNAYFSPTLNFHGDSTGLQYAISVDDEQPQIISINKNDSDKKVWSEWVANNINIQTTNHSINENGKHVIKYWMISSAVVLQKLVLDFGGLQQSYLGPKETNFKCKKTYA